MFFYAITGETGAGKTMLLTALRLLTGGRAEPRIIKTGRGRTEVDAIISVPTAVANDLEEAGFQVDEGEVAFARTVTPSRSRAAISGRPVPARALADTAGSLITIHGQADQWRLKSQTHQRELLNRYAPPPHEREKSVKGVGHVARPRWVDAHGALLAHYPPDHSWH